MQNQEQIQHFSHVVMQMASLFPLQGCVGFFPVIEKLVHLPSIWASQHLTLKFALCQTEAAAAFEGIQH